MGFISSFEITWVLWIPTSLAESSGLPQKQHKSEVRACHGTQVGGTHSSRRAAFSSELGRHICLLLARAGGDQPQDIEHPPLRGISRRNIQPGWWSESVYHQLRDKWGPRGGRFLGINPHVTVSLCLCFHTVNNHPFYLFYFRLATDPGFFYGIAIIQGRIGVGPSHKFQQVALGKGGTAPRNWLRALWFYSTALWPFESRQSHLFAWQELL